MQYLNYLEIVIFTIISFLIQTGKSNFEKIKYLIIWTKKYIFLIPP